MERRALGTSDLFITPVGLGTWAIGGGDWIFGWGPQRDSESVATIRRALDAGLNWIDTAAVYGLGHAETVVARALGDVPRREWPYIFTNYSLVWDELGNVSQSFRPDAIRREAEASLRRLKIECFDLYQLGWPASPNIPFDSDGSLDDAWDMMGALQREGKARFIGVSNCTVGQLDSLHQAAPVTSLQAPYSLLRREIEDGVLPFCQSHRIGVIAYASIQSGLLAGRMTADAIDRLPHNDWRRRSPEFHEPARGRALAIVDRLRAVGADGGRTPAQVAIAWALHNPAVTTVSVGLRQPQQVDEIVRAASLRLSAAEVADLEHESLEFDHAHHYRRN